MKQINESARGLLHRPGSSIAKSLTSPGRVHADKRRKALARAKRVDVRKDY